MQTENNLHSIHPMVLRIDTIGTFDIFAKKADGKIVPFFKAGEKYSHIQHGSLFRDDITELYVPVSDMKQYFTYIEEYLPIIMADPIIDIESKASIAHGLLTYAAKRVNTDLTADSIIAFKNIIKEIVSLIAEEQDAIKYMISFTKKEFSFCNHMINVGIYGIGLAEEIFEKQLQSSMDDIACGLFLHDIGMYSIPKSIEEKNGPLTEEEWKIVRKHPKIGFNFLNKMDILTEESKTIILQHHERQNGTGYPSGLKGDQINTYGKICSIADAFDALTANRPYRQAQTSFNALNTMHTEMKNEFDPFFFSKFVLLFSKQKLFTKNK